MQRSSESIACLAAALAKAQAELTNPEKSLVATIRPNGPGIMRDSGARTLAPRPDDGEGPRTPSWKLPLSAGHDPRTPLESSLRLAAVGAAAKGAGRAQSTFHLRSFPKAWRT
jgi:hypothetical protein